MGHKLNNIEYKLRKINIFILAFFNIVLIRGSFHKTDNSSYEL